MEPLTAHETFWAVLMQLHAQRPNPRRGSSRWTGPEILACLQSWAAQEERCPTSSELGRKNLLPSYGSIVAIMGSVRAAYEALAWYYPGYGEARLTQRQGGRTPNRQCLACDRAFYSPDPLTIRICPMCKETDAWQHETGIWMNGVAVCEAWEGVIDFWEVTADGINRPGNRTPSGPKALDGYRASATDSLAIPAEGTA